MTARTLAAALALVAASMLLAAGATAQTAAPAPPTGRVLTLFVHPQNGIVEMDGAVDVRGWTPIDLPAGVTGRYSVVVEGDGLARTQGILYFPSRGEAALILSEPPGMSPGLFVRSFGYPGFPNISAKRAARGFIMTAAATGALAAGTLAHLDYRDRLNETGTLAALRVHDERRERNSWAIYAGSVWLMSALDYWIRPRFDVEPVAAAQVSLVVPRATRGAAIWRSILVPGAGQEFANRRTRGAIWLAGVLATSAAYAVADARVQRTETDLTWALVRADSVGPTERLELLREAEIHRRDLDSDRDLRRAFGYAAVGLYAANVLDAALIALDHTTSEALPRLSATVIPVRRDGPAVALTLRY